ncbi:MAG TPA: hypothetical protein VLA02_02715 [Reyranella sp.]|nr:hypothetical protein [Reyranella sp.]
MLPFVVAATLKIVSIPLACAALSGLAGIILGSAPVYAHDWYPLECCARNDCMPAGGIERDGRGGMTVIVDDLRIGLPEGFAPRRSLDSRIHVCFRVHSSEIDGSISSTPVCLFLPAQV